MKITLMEINGGKKKNPDHHISLNTANYILSCASDPKLFLSFHHSLLPAISNFLCEPELHLDVS